MHFQYEESLLDAHLYKDWSLGKSKWRQGFSAALDARKSHYRDHERLIGEIEETLSCADNDDERLPAKFVSEVLRNFERHANVYDDGYADALHAALHWMPRLFGMGDMTKFYAKNQYIGSVSNFERSDHAYDFREQQQRPYSILLFFK